MADSDNTTTLPLVTRRSVLAGTAIAIAGWQRKAFAGNALETDLPADPAVAVGWLYQSKSPAEVARLIDRVEAVGDSDRYFRVLNGASL